MAKYYPERLALLLLINCPSILAGLWRAIRPLVEERYLSMIHFLSPGEITKFIEPSNVPVEYGGSQHLDWEEWQKRTRELLLSDKGSSPAILHPHKLHETILV